MYVCSHVSFIIYALASSGVRVTRDGNKRASTSLVGHKKPCARNRVYELVSFPTAVAAAIRWFDIYTQCVRKVFTNYVSVVDMNSVIAHTTKVSPVWRQDDFQVSRR